MSSDIEYSERLNDLSSRSFKHMGLGLLSSAAGVAVEKVMPGTIHDVIYDGGTTLETVGMVGASALYATGFIELARGASASFEGLFLVQSRMH